MLSRKYSHYLINFVFKKLIFCNILLIYRIWLVKTLLPVFFFVTSTYLSLRRIYVFLRTCALIFCNILLSFHGWLRLKECIQHNFLVECSFFLLSLLSIFTKQNYASFYIFVIYFCKYTNLIFLPWESYAISLKIYIFIIKPDNITHIYLYIYIHPYFDLFISIYTSF